MSSVQFVLGDENLRRDEARSIRRNGGSEVFRSHRRGLLEKYLLCAIQVRPFRCVNCNARFYRHKHSDDPASRDMKAA